MATRKKKAPTPEPITITVVCSLCGEPWDSHLREEDGSVSTMECIRLLKAKVAAQPVTKWYPQPYPYPWPQRPWWQQPYVTYGTWSGSSSGNISTSQFNVNTTPTVTYNTPTKVLNAST